MMGKFRRRLALLASMVLLCLNPNPSLAQTSDATVIRIAELEIDPAQLDLYTAAVKEEMDDALRLEPGVLAIYAVAKKAKPNHLYFFEIYASEDSYLAHRETPHFRKYLAITEPMILSRRLIETVPVHLRAKPR